MTASPSADEVHRQRALLALSFAPGLTLAARDRLERRGRAALSLLCEGAAVRVRARDAGLVVLEAGTAAPGSADEDGAFAYSVGVGGTDWCRERACDGPSLLAALRNCGAAALADYVPPFGVVFRRRSESPLEAATDACGILHVYVTAGPGFAACGSSSLVLGALGDGDLDLEALAQYARLGYYGDARTPCRGVRRLLAGEACTLTAGALAVRRWRRDARPEPHFPTFAAAVQAGAEAVRAAVGAVATAHERIGLSLSGGLDSRLLLAALPPARRAALEVLCIEAPRSDDAVVVRQLAAQFGLRPTIIDVRAFPGENAVPLAERASRGRDHCANPLTVAILEWVESGMPPTPRLNGQNGEFARGVYYGDLAADRVTRQRVMTLFQGRRFTGRCASARVLAPAYREPIAAALRAEFLHWAEGTGLPWLEVLDEYYLTRFTAGWIGIELSRTSMRRIDLSPFFDPRFIAAARRASPYDKWESRLMAAVLETLDPALAAIPLERRPSPAALWRGGPVPPGAAPPRQAGPGAERADARHIPVGADLVRAQLVAQADLIGPAVARVAALPLFDGQGLAELMAPHAAPDLVTLGFVLNVAWILEFLERARAASPSAGDGVS